MEEGTLYLAFSSHKVNKRDKISLDTASLGMELSWKSTSKDLHTVLFYSIKDAQVSELLYCAVNIPDMRLDLSEQIVPYQSPTKLGIYKVELLRQPSRVEDAGGIETMEEIAEMAGNMKRVDTVAFEIVSDEEAVKEEGRGRRCRCILDVAAKQSEECLKGLPETARKKISGKTCYNPYPICVASTKVGGRVSCYDYYQPQSLPDEQLKAFAIMEHIPTPSPFDRKETIKAIEAWKRKKM